MSLREWSKVGSAWIGVAAALVLAAVPARADTSCGAGELCELPDDTCSSADLGGTCVAVPEICTHQSDPVCGCDGVTYPNDCERRGAAVNKAHDGACAQ